MGLTAGAAPGPAAPTALRLLLVFSRIGLTSFGGGMSGWLMREFVTERGWVAEEDFLNGLALAQALPGVNVTNMAIWLGHRLAGLPGAAAGVFGIVVPPALLIVAIAGAFEGLRRFPATHLALDGAAAAAVGLSATMGIVAARRVPRRLVPLALMGATFAAIGPLGLPLVPVVLAASALGVAAEAARLRRGARP